MKGVSLQAHVGAAKAGVDSLTRTCAVEFGPYGVRVNAVAPGRIGGTEGVRRFAEATGSDADADENPRASNPLGIDGHGTDIAYTVLFLCSPAARFISGQVIAVDGGGSVDQLKMGLGPVLSRLTNRGGSHGGVQRGALHHRGARWRRSCSTCRRSTSSAPT